MKLASLRLKQRNTKSSRVYNLNLQIRIENVLDHSFKKNFFVSSQNSFGKSLQKSSETFFSPILTFSFLQPI